MIKTILLLLFIIFLAWLTIDYFSITLPTTQPSKQIEHSKSIESSQVSKPQISTSSIESKEKGITLSQLLENNLFYDALALYLDNSTEENRKQIESYLTALAKTNPTLALEYMQVFLDNVPESMVWKLMITTHIAQGNLERAIELIMQAKEDYVSEDEDKRLATELRDVAMQHIEVLFQRKEYAKLIAFLEDMIAYDGEDNFYKFRLAQLYMRLDKVDEAGMLLEGLQYDEVYAQNVKSLLNIIDKEEEDEYKYAIPLQKYGNHYVVNLFLDDNAFTLVLDTGASYIFIDEDKASMLEVIRDDLVLQTAGNNVSAKLCNASSLRVGNLDLSNIEVTIAPFKREGIDGLLGMNFFKQFTFFINQEESILYLNPR
jgi:clan AA aspartic protease (TIGR02281 family)